MISARTMSADRTPISMQVSAAANSEPQSTFRGVISYYTDIFTTFAGTVRNFLSGIFSTGTRRGIEGTARIGSGNTLVSAQLQGRRSAAGPIATDTITCTSQAGSTQTVSGAQHRCDGGKTIVTVLAPSGASTWVLVLGSDGSIEQQLNCFDQIGNQPPSDFTNNQYCITYAPGNNHEAGLGRYLVACRSTVGSDACLQDTTQPTTQQPPAQTSLPPSNNDASLGVVPLLVHRGYTTQVSWTSQNARSCTVSGTNGDAWKGTSGKEISTAINQRTTYTLACSMKDDQRITKTETVTIVPTFQER